MIIFDLADLKILNVNQSACRVYGYSQNEFNELNVTNLHPESSRSSVSHLLYRETLGYDDNGIWIHKKKDGGEFPVRIFVQTVQYKGKHSKLSIIQDLSSQVEPDEVLKLAYNKLKYHIINSPLAVIEWDKYFRLTSWSKKAENIFGYTETEVLGHTLFRLSDFVIEPLNLSKIKDSIFKIIRGIENNSQFELKIKTASGNIIYTRWYNSALYSDDGRVISLLSFVEDITDRKKSGRKLKESQRLYKSLFDNALDSILLANDDAGYIDANQSASHLLGFSKEELNTLNLIDVIPEPNKDEALRDWKKFIKTGYASGEFKLKTKNGEIIDSEFRAVSNIMPGIHLSILHNITKRKIIEKELLEEKKFTDSVVNSLPGLFFVSDEEGNLVRWNDNMEKILGYTAEELAKVNPLDFYAEEDREMALHKIMEVNQLGRSNAEMKLQTKNGEKIPFFINASLINYNDKKYIVGASVDISKLKETEEIVLNSLKEKEVLLAEIHHRVKNNLAVISGLLHLQRDITDDENAQKALYDSQLRIHSIAMIHEMLYKNEYLSKIKFDVYAKHLCQYIFESWDLEEYDNYTIQECNTYLNVNQAIPLALILNELINNALKHGVCKKCGNGHVRILFQNTGSDFIMQVKDNGPGIPENKNFGGYNSLGMKLIQALTKQLKASFDYEYDEGAVITIKFEMDQPNKIYASPMVF